MARKEKQKKASLIPGQGFEPTNEYTRGYVGVDPSPLEVPFLDQPRHNRMKLTGAGGEQGSRKGVRSGGMSGALRALLLRASDRHDSQAPLQPKL